MSAFILRGRIVMMLVAVAGVLYGGLVTAGSRYLEYTDYEEEINRCIDLLRPAVQAADMDKVTYDVREIDRRGPWYKFEIYVTVEDQAGAKRIDGYKVGCKFNRRSELAELIERQNATPLPLGDRLFASK